MFDFPDRVYLLRGSTPEEDVLYLARKLSQHNTSPGNLGKYSLVTLDLDKIPKSVGLFADPNYEYGVFTPNNITPESIADIKDLKL